MTHDTIRRKTHELHAKTRRTLLGGMAASLLTIVLAGYGITQGGNAILRAVFAAAIAWALAGQYFLYRGMPPGKLPDEAGLRPGVGSYRLEIERRRYLFGRFLVWSLGPVVLVIAALIALLVDFGTGERAVPLTGVLRRMIPFLVLLVLWIAVVILLRIKARRQLQREIEEFQAVENANGG